MIKHDYVADVSEAEKRSAIVALLIGTMVSAACMLIVIGVAIAGIIDASAGAFYGCIAIFGTVSVLCGWMLVRLLRNQRAANRRTVMPEWFIQIFGLLFLIGLCTTAILTGRLWFFGEAVGVAFAMIGIRSFLRQ